MCECFSLQGFKVSKMPLFGRSLCCPSVSISPELTSSSFCDSQQWIYGSIWGIYAVIFPKSKAVLISALLSLLTAGFITVR